MNIYKKIMDVRVKFNSLDIKKSGFNKFANFKYFELADFLPQATQLLNDAGLCPVITFSEEVATLTLTNADNTEECVVFTSPMRSLSLKGANEMQSLGGVETYQTRYLYTQLLSITEHDLLDATSGQNSEQTQTNGPTQPQLERLYTLATQAGYDKEKTNSMIWIKYKKRALELTKEEYDTVCAGLEKINK